MQGQQRAAPQFIYKHVPWRWARANLSGRSIQFGTHQYYRTMEEQEFPDEYSRIDRVEGVTINRLDGIADETNRVHLEGLKGSGPAPFSYDAGSTVEFSNVIDAQYCTGSWLFCASLSPNFDLCRKKHQVALKIDVEKFFTAITLDIYEAGFQEWEWGYVSYDKQEGDPLAGNVAYSDPYCKPPSFSFEEEFRVMLNSSHPHNEVVQIQSKRMGRAMTPLHTPPA